MTEMMLTGRIYDAPQGQQLGLAHYAVEETEGMELARSWLQTPVMRLCQIT